MTDEIAWVIERGESSPASPSYLMVEGAHADSPHQATGRLAWTNSNIWALRFARKEDATLFIGVMRDLYDDLPRKKGLYGLCSGDKAPRVCEHVWVDRALSKSGGDDGQG